MRIRYTTENSVYVVDTDDRTIVRTAGVNEPTAKFSTGEPAAFSDVLLVNAGTAQRLFIYWPDYTSTTTSYVTGFEILESR